MNGIGCSIDLISILNVILNILLQGAHFIELNTN